MRHNYKIRSKIAFNILTKRFPNPLMLFWLTLLLSSSILEQNANAASTQRSQQTSVLIPIIKSPATNQRMVSPASFPVSVTVLNQALPTSNYIKVTSSDNNYRKLQLAYGKTSLTSTVVDVISGGNDSMIIVFKDFKGNADFSKLYIRIADKGLVLLPYANAAKLLDDGWKRIAIPLKMFDSTIDFKTLTYLQVFWGNTTYELGLREIKFVGGTSPIQWFGISKLDNYFDGSSADGKFIVQLVDGVAVSAIAKKASFYLNNQLFATDSVLPFKIWLTNIAKGNHNIIVKITDNHNAIQTSDTLKTTVYETFTKNSIILTITFANAISDLEIEKAALRYNKHFAYSLTFDDTYRNNFTNAFPLLNGGVGAGGKSYPGLKYTNGCGSDINFAAGLAWVSRSTTDGSDIHTNSTSYINWNEASKMVEAGWNIFNHSYEHKYGLGTNYNYQVTENNKDVLSKLGYNLLHFVIPTGDNGYIEPAFANGMTSISSNNSNFEGVLNGVQVDESNLQNLDKFKMYRRLLEDKMFDNGLNEVISLVDTVSKLSKSGSHFWFNEFTHGTGETRVNASLLIQNLETYGNYIAQKYGKSGTDEIWMAPIQDVYEYLSTRNSAKIETSVNNKTMTIAIDTTLVPKNMQRRMLSLNLLGTNKIASVTSNMANLKISFNQSTQNPLVNLDWNGSAAYKKVISANIKNIDLSNQLKIVNTPIAQNQEQIDFIYSATSESKITIANSLGKIIFTGEIDSRNNGYHTVKTGILSSGIYLLTLTSQNNQMITKKFLVR